MGLYQIWRIPAALMLSVCLVSPALAQDWGVVLNGKAIHIDSSRDWNESNWGLGFEREFDRQARWVKVVVGNGFRDSEEHMSYMAGGGIKRRFHLGRIHREAYVDLGVIAFMMSREMRHDTRVFPGLLPALTVGSRNMALNVTYLPRTWADKATHITRSDPTTDGILFMQLKFDARLLGFGRRAQAVFAAADD